MKYYYVTSVVLNFSLFETSAPTKQVFRHSAFVSFLNQVIKIKSIYLREIG